MKKIIKYVAFLCLISCVGTDIVDDEISEQARITNPLVELAIGNTHTFESVFLDNSGQKETDVIASWRSSDESILTIEESTGVATAVGFGEVEITLTITIDDDVFVETLNLLVSNQTVTTPMIRSGTINTTSFYTLTGNFTLSEDESTDTLTIDIDSTYQSSDTVPGLYLYLSNNPNSIAGALEVGPVSVFSGAHSYTITDPTAGVNTYNHLVYWCKPFSIKVGEGNFIE